MSAGHGDTHWNKVSDHWAFLGPPLKPGPEDIDIVLGAIERYRARVAGRPYRAVLWGVTPELASMGWPDETELVAIDRSDRMISLVWPGNVPGVRRAVVGEWSETLRIVGAPCDLILGDGSLNDSPFPDEYRDLMRAARKCLDEQGLVVMRLHARPESSESVTDVVEDLIALKIGSFHVFKFRLAMALQESPEAGIELSRVWEGWRALGIREKELAERTGWDLRVIHTIDLYRDNPNLYSFPTLAQQLEVFELAGFDAREVIVPSYEMGDRRPIVVLSCRG